MLLHTAVLEKVGEGGGGVRDVVILNGGLMVKKSVSPLRDCPCGQNDKEPWQPVGGSGCSRSGRLGSDVMLK